MTDGTVPEQIIINGQTYSPEDATHLIELGNKWQETESKLNTSLDKVYPEYTRLSQEKKDWEKERADKDAKIAELSKPKEPEQPADPDVTKIRTAARQVGLVDEDLLNEKGYVRKEDLDKYFSEKQTQQKLVENVLTKAKELETQIDGSDGRVPFDSDAVLAYASAYNIDDLEQAYDKMNAKGNAKWKEAQIAKEEKPGLTTLKGTGKKEPERQKITDDNLGAHLDEWMKEVNLGKE